MVPCGSCIGCRAEQARQWGVRMMHEERMHKSSLFITLTLHDRYLNENKELVPKDFSAFVKRLRKTQETKISFFGCGEYGGRSGRPHYHACLFGMDFKDRVKGDDGSGRDFWQSRELEEIWGKGIAEVGMVTMASARYVAGYMKKKLKMKDYARANPLTGELLEPEFARMSLRPAIGVRWIEKWWRDVYPKDFVVCEGYEAKPPRFYDKFMDREDEQGGTEERRAIMEKVRDRRCDEAIEKTKYQRVAGEKIANSRANLYEGRASI